MIIGRKEGRKKERDRERKKRKKREAILREIHGVESGNKDIKRDR